MIPLSCQRGTLHIGLALVWDILLSSFSMDTTSKQDIDVEKILFPKGESSLKELYRGVPLVEWLSLPCLMNWDF